MKPMPLLLAGDIVPLIAGYATRVVGVIVLFIIAFLFARWVRDRVASTVQRSPRIDPTLAKFFSTASYWVILVLAGLTALSAFGVAITSFAAIIGAAGLAIGLAFQGSLSNLAAGMMLLIFRPFKVGDVVVIGSVTGKVDEIELFTTKVDTFDNRRIILPNAGVFNSTIENVTFHPTRRIDVSVGTEYSASIDDVRAVLEATARAVEGGLEVPETQVVLLALGASSIDWQVRVWCKTPEFAVIKQRVIRDVKYALDEAGFGIPFPQMDVHLDPPTLKQAA